MVHGAFCGGWAFDAFRRPFEALGHEVLAIDLPGHGAVPDRSLLSRSSMSDYANAVVKACAQFDEPPILIGHSLGGLVTQIAATRMKPKAVVLLAPSAPWGIQGSSLEEGASAVGLYALGAFWCMAVDPDYGLAAGYSLDRFDPAERRAVFARMSPESGRALWETLNWWMDPFMTTLVPAHRLSAPVLAVAGGRDLIHPPSTVRQTAARLDGEILVFEQMSHWLIGEPGWEGVASAVLDWIGQR